MKKDLSGSSAGVFADRDEHPGPCSVGDPAYLIVRELKRPARVLPDRRKCYCEKSYHLKGTSVQTSVYGCSRCKRHFTTTTKTPMQSTKLGLSKWLLASYLIINSSKGISSVYLGKLISISQKSAWKFGHTIRAMMDPGSELAPALTGIVWQLWFRLNL